ncbi:MAG: glycosyltransferase [Caulobacter sp.]|nr:glycosyltransferase [Caulobacter sp.]
MITVIVPTLNSARRLPVCLAALVPAAVDAIVGEVILADGGSTDATLEIAEEAGARIVTGGLAAAVASARGDWLLHLLPTTRLEPDWAPQAMLHMQSRPDEAAWFRFALEDSSLTARLTEVMRRLAPPRPDQGRLVRAGQGMAGRGRGLTARAFNDPDAGR